MRFIYCLIFSVAAGCVTAHSDQTFIVSKPTEQARAVCYPDTSDVVMPICVADSSADTGCRDRGPYGENIVLRYGEREISLRVGFKKGFEIGGPFIFPFIPVRTGPWWPNRLIVSISQPNDSSISVEKSALSIQQFDGVVLRPLDDKVTKRSETIFEFPERIPDQFILLVDGVVVEGVKQHVRQLAIQTYKNWNFEFFLLYPSSDWRYAGQAPCR